VSLWRFRLTSSTFQSSIESIFLTETMVAVHP
jgi:hypothetical protein